MCRFASVILFNHVALSFCSVVCFGHFPLSLSSVMFVCRVLLSSSLVVFIWHSEIVIYSRVSFLTFFDMDEEVRTWVRREVRKEGGGRGG